MSSERTKLIVKLRKETGAPIGWCKEALVKYDNDYQKALEYIKLKMEEKAEKFGIRETKYGIIETYSHGQAKNVGVMVEVHCQTDFGSRNEQFRQFVHEIALQIAAMRPKYVSIEDVPEEEMNKMRQMYREELAKSGKPEQVIEKIVEGKIRKWLESNVLLEQEYFRDDKRKIKDLLKEHITTLGENIKIVRFVRWEM